MPGGTETYQLTDVGSTEALIFPQPTWVMHRLQQHIQGTLWGILDAGSVLTWQMEASPDGKAWMPINGFIDLQMSKFNVLTGYVFAIRGTVTVFTSGRLTIYANWSM